MIAMAIAGLQNVPILDSSILSDPRPSTSSGQHGNRDRAISRTSSILQMWRELEDECLATRSHERFGGRLQNETGDAVSSAILTSNLHQAQDSENVNVTGTEDSVESQTEQDDHISLTSEQSQDLGEPERERVRQIFREWMSTGGNGLASNGSSMNSSPRAQLLGRTELERIRVVREWIQTACDQRESFGSNREEHVTEIGSQIERVREGLVVTHGERPTENNRKDIRRLCGRQALVDLLANNERERQRELQVLLERCPVSTFAYRNRIQSLMRIRLLHNRSVEYNRTNSTAESELGFLRQRNTVSGLRYVERIANSKWELKELGMEHNCYVDLLLGEFKHYRTRIAQVQDTLLDYGVEMVAQTLIEGLSRVKRCNDEGRASMSLDLQVLINGLQMFGLKDVKQKLQIVDAFIKAFYLPDTEYVNWAHAHPVYTKNQVIGLVNLVATMKGWKRKTKSEVLEKIESHP